MSSPTPTNLRRFFDLTRDAMIAARPTPSARSLIDRGFADLERAASPSIPCEPAATPACAALPAALSAARRAAPALAEALEILSPSLRWRRRAGSEPAPDGFADRHANAYIVGDGGLATARFAVLGVSLMAAGTAYPDHRHPPEELYIALSDSEWRQEDGAWFAPGPGGLVHNPSNIRHAMRATAAPLLAIWLLHRAEAEAVAKSP